MTITVEVEGIEVPLEFPDGTDPTVIQATVKKQLNLPPVEPPPGQESAGGSTRRTPGQALLSVASSVIAEPIAGLAGLASAPFVGVDKATDIIGKTREALTFKPPREEGREAGVAGRGRTQGATSWGLWEGGVVRG